jgi:hypothetical protein
MLLPNILLEEWKAGSLVKYGPASKLPVFQSSWWPKFAQILKCTLVIIGLSLFYGTITSLGLEQGLTPF